MLLKKLAKINIRILWPAIIFVVISLSLLIIPYIAHKKKQAAEAALLPAGYTHGIREAQNPHNADRAIFATLKNDHIADIYIDISSYINADESENGNNENDNSSAQSKNDLAEYITEAQAHGIAVHALAGSPEWGTASHRHVNERLIDFASTYNNEHPEALLAGIHFDIAIYESHGFAGKENVYLREYLDTMVRIVKKMNTIATNGEQSLRLGITIPAWFDGNHGAIKKISWQGEEKFVFNHLAKIVNQYENTYIVVKVHDESPQGTDDSIAEAQDEITFVAEYASRLTIYIEIATQDVQPSTITSYTKRREKVQSTTRMIAQEFENKKIFGGFIIHDTEGYKNLKK